jgi:hypothetical protein
MQFRRSGGTILDSEPLMLPNDLLGTATLATALELADQRVRQQAKRAGSVSDGELYVAYASGSLGFVRSL